MQTSTSLPSGRSDIGRLPSQPPPEAAICARGLGKVYRNPWTLHATIGLSALDLEVRRGEVLGLLGPNGAGKTTTLKLLTGLLRPTEGRAWILGKPVGETSSRAGLGFLPEQPYFYDYLTGPELLEYAGRLSGLGAQEAARRGVHWLGRVGLGGEGRLRLRKYSKGMLQRLGLAAALLHEPEVIILDEPMSGLDPFGRRDVRELILEQKERGATVLFSSHILPDVEMLCDRVAILLQGRLQRIGGLGDLLRGVAQRIELRFVGAPPLEFPPAWAERVTRMQRPGETLLSVSDDELAQEVLGWAVRQGLKVVAVTPQRASLEDLFLSTADDARRPSPDPAMRRSA